ncbi:kinesin family member 19 [Achlya hypogyna]|uniref:Kinesin-like protein n=1 Tax=Achlya hypogyna TaxID=1202772 RepID=A0A1V9ZMK8_ACHHY|nr:kinesin family member 19 [Achlya hypogyna]
MTEEEIPNVVVAVRLRPFTTQEVVEGHHCCCRVVGDQTVVIHKEPGASRHLKTQQGSSNEYGYDMVFSDKATQDEVYSRTVKNIIPTILDGYNATIFAYGATGAGKTHTMMGSERDGSSMDELIDPEYEDGSPRALPVDGIIPQSLSDIFRLIHERQVDEKVLQETEGLASNWTVTVSYLEVYNETIRDLLNPQAKNLQLREHSTKGAVHVSNLKHVVVKNAVEVLQLLRQGNRNRQTKSTAANQVSSRSHAVLQVTIKHTASSLLLKNSPNKEITNGKLSLIDLAGSERASNTQNSGARLTEGANINKSLLALANCINALSTANQNVIRRRSDSMVGIKEPRPFPTRAKFRDSKLTHLLKSSLEGDCRLVMIANINPSHKSFEESHNTLKYANRAKNIKIRPKMHVVTAEMSTVQRADQLEAENLTLRRELAKRKSVDQSMITGLSLGDAKRAKLSSASKTDSNVHVLHRTIEKLESEKKVLLDKVRDMERELSRLRVLRNQAPRTAPTPTKPSPGRPSPAREQSREPAPTNNSADPRRRLSSHPVVFRSATTPQPTSTPKRRVHSGRESLIPRLSVGAPRTS